MSIKLVNGDKAPEFNLLDQHNNNVCLKDYIGKKVLLYFYPKANTTGCTAQACDLRDNRPEFDSLNVDIVGISPDLTSKLAGFDEKHSLSFKLLSDEDHSIASSYGVWGEKKLYGKVYMGIIRSSFLIDESGVILDSWYKISPKKTVPEVMKYLKS